MQTLHDRVAVVTGAASGIGLAIAQALAREGAQLMLADVDDEPLAEAAEQLAQIASNVAFMRTDVTNPDDVDRLAETTSVTFGAVHLLCNSAGVDSGGSFAEIPLRVWDWVFAVNFWGVLYGCRAFLPLLRQEDQSHIVNVASHAALTGYFPAGAPYVTSKYAVLGLSEHLYHELSLGNERVGVSVLCPSYVNTRMPYSERNRPPDVPSMDSNAAWAHHQQITRQRSAAGLDPSLVATQVIDAIRLRRFFVLPHRDQSVAAFDARRAWLADNIAPTFPAPSVGRP